MSNRHSIFYLLALLVLAVVANLWLDISGWERGEVVRRQTLLAGADAARAVEIEAPGRPTVRLERSDRWRLVLPFRAVADQSAVAQLTDALAFGPLPDSLSVDAAVKLGRATSEFGLDAPRLVVKVWEGGRESKVEFGTRAPSEEGCYARVDGGSVVYIVPDETFAAANRSLDAWRRRTLFRMKPDELTAIDLRRGDVSVRLAKSGENWQIVEPRSARASSAAVTRIVDTLLTLEAQRFVWPDGATNETVSVSASRLSGYGLDPETCETVVFRSADGSDQSISFGSSAESNTVYALIHGGTAVATVDAAARSAVSLDLGSLIEGRLFPLDRSAVRRISMTDGDTVYLLARGEQGSWRIDSPVSAAADESAVAALVDKLLVMRSSDLAEDGVRVALASNAVPVTVSRTALLGEAGFEQLRSKVILDIEAATVRRLVITTAGRDKPEAVVFDPERKGWNVDTSGRAGVIDQERLTAVLAALSPLKAKAVAQLKVAPGELGKYGLDAAACTIAVDRLLENSVRRNILLGAVVNDAGDAYATVGSSDAVFVLDGETVRILKAGVLTE